MTSKIHLQWILELVCISGIVFAFTPKIKSTVHIQENTIKGEAVAEISQLVKKHGTHGLQKTYKIISQKVSTKPPSFGASSRVNEKWLEIGKTSGTVRLSEEFDRNAVCHQADECTIQIEIVILPHKIFQLVELEVVIDDVNDHNPVFPDPTVYLSLSENALVGEIINLDAYQASDKDTGRNSILRYTMTPDAHFRLEFHIDDKNSSHLRLHVTKTLDHESTPEITLDIFARDAGTPSLTGRMQLKIKILDTNDNYPIFEKELYVASLQENSPAGTTIATVKANDGDGGLFGQIRYSISPRNHALVGKLVKIDQRKGTVTLQEPLDRETHNELRILIEARDSDPENPKTGETWLTIIVSDINDNSPSILIDFISQSVGNTVYFAESTANGSYIAKVSVRDNDVGKNGEIDLSITSVPVKSKRFKNLKKYDDIEYFSLTNDGFLISQQAFDRETCSRYRVLIEACDHGTPPLCTRKEINVVILDVNEYAPDIETTLEMVTLREDAYIGTVIAKIVATDSDGANGYALTKNATGDIVRSRNGEISYSISRGNKVLFSIDKKSGKVRLSAPLDREKRAEWKLTVSVRDGGYPQLESFCTIIVKVTDVNDNSPIFVNPGVNNTLIYADISRNEVITKIRARDFDAGENGKVTYYILPRPSSETKSFGKKLTMNNSYFMLNPTNGDLRLNFSKPNISNAVGIHNFVIKAKDAGAVPLETNINLRVEVGEYGNRNLKLSDVEEASTSMNFLVLAISLGCATTFLLFLIIGIVIRCQKINREISSLTRKPGKKQRIDEKSFGAELSFRDEIEVKNHEKETKKNECTNVVGDNILQKQSNSQHNIVLDLQMSSNNQDDVALPSDNDSGKGESDIEAASLLVNGSKAYTRQNEPVSKCTEKCRIYGHSDECWMPTKDEDILNTTVSSQLTHYDWSRLKPRYFSSVHKNRQGSRCSYASTSNTDNDSAAPSAATSHHSVHQIVYENAQRQQLTRGLEQLFAARAQRSIFSHQCYPGLPLKYNNISTKPRTQSCSSTANQQLDA